MCKKSFLIAALLFAGAPHAGTSFEFAANTDGTFRCSGPGCVGYTADKPGHLVKEVALQKRVATRYVFSVNVDGRVYSATTSGAIPSVLIAGDGRYILAGVSAYRTHHHCARSGRATVCVTNYNVYTGTVQIP